MGKPAEIAEQLPDFALIPERKGLAELLGGAKKRQAAAQVRSLRFFVFPWGIG